MIGDPLQAVRLCSQVADGQRLVTKGVVGRGIGKVELGGSEHQVFLLLRE